MLASRTTVGVESLVDRMMDGIRDLSIEAIEPLDIDEVMVNLFIDLDLNDMSDDDMISVPGLIDDIGYLGDCEDIINNWTDLQSAPNYVRTDLQSAPNYVRNCSK